jgi:prepilin-type N-terminal cleavage/methylation domain-containing protein/prepilin-type processing-associated H-X9-DG protein
MHSNIIIQEKKMQKKKGFTLIELLVVIAIIAILAAILFPVFARARENARRASCQSNLKQLALGVFQYTQDYDEKYPLVAVATTNPTATNPFGWADALQPYLKSTQLFQCPSETGAPTSNVDTTNFPNTIAPTYGQYTDYWFNGQLAGQSQAAVEAVALTIMNGDGSGGTAANAYTTSTVGTSRYQYDGCTNNAPSSPATTTCAAYAATRNYITGLGTAHGRHLDGGNFAFADGHVKWLKGNGSPIDRSTAVRDSAWTSANSGQVPTFSIN